MTYLVLKIFFASDVHGSEICWRKFLRSIDFYKADIGILGGDVTGKMVVPVIKEDSEYTYNLFGRVNSVREEDLEGECAKIANAGFYYYVCDGDEADRLGGDRKGQDQLFNKLMIERLQSWLGMASERVRGEPRIYMMPGNDDRFVIDGVLDKADSVIYCEGKCVELPGGYEMVTCGWVNPTPWDTSREIADDKLEVKLEDLMSKVKGTNRLICNFHAPPYNSGLDTAPKINSDLSVKTGVGGIELAPVGSTAVRRIIEKYRPLLGLHGHIHESGGFKRFARTLSVNPGSEYGEGILRGYLLVLGDDRVQGHWRVGG